MSDEPYMNCTHEDVNELQERKAAMLKKNRNEHRAECMSMASGMIPVRLAGFENPYNGTAQPVINSV